MPRLFYSRSHHRFICRTFSINMKQTHNSPFVTLPLSFALLLSIRTVKSAPLSVVKSSLTIERQKLNSSTKSSKSQLSPFNPIKLLFKMKFSIVLAVAALSAETFACANIGQACKKGDPDVCQCGAPLTVSPNTLTRSCI